MVQFIVCACQFQESKLPNSEVAGQNLQNMNVIHGNQSALAPHKLPLLLTHVGGQWDILETMAKWEGAPHKDLGSICMYFLHPVVTGSTYQVVFRAGTEVGLTHNPSTQETEAEQSRGRDQPGLCNKTLCKETSHPVQANLGHIIRLSQRSQV